MVRLLDNRLTSDPQSVADANQQGAEHGLLAFEVSVDGGTAHPHGCAEVFERHSGEAPARELLRGRVEKRLTAIGLGEASQGGFGHGLSVDIPVNWR